MSVKIKGIYYLAIWLIILLLEFAFFVFSVKTPVVDSILNVIQRVPSELLVFFVSIKIIIPRYSVSKSYLRLILHVFLLLIVSVFIYRVCQYYAFPRFRLGKDFIESMQKMPHFYLDFFYFLRNPIIAILVYYLPKYWEAESNKNEAEKHKVIAESNLLKSQIQPHFLFNTLNNLYSLTLESSKLAPEYVLKLSKIMEYMLYKANKDLIPLKMEMDHITNYVELEKLKLQERLEVSWDIDKTVLNLKIPPLLFFPFIENAFKHGATKNINSTWISISLRFVGDSLSYTVVNSLPDFDAIKSEDNPGQGLDVLQNRLKLLFPNKHILSHKTNGDTYMAVLELKNFIV